MHQLRCALCGDVIGFYESARVILEDGSDRLGSPLTLRPELQKALSILVHEHCYREHVRDRPIE